MSRDVLGGQADTFGGSSNLSTVTKRVSLPIGSDGQNFSVSTFVDFVQRQLIQLPFSTTRWRLRFRNSISGTAAGASETHQTGALAVPGVYLGDPSYPAADGIWVGALASTPVQALSSFSTNADGSDYITSWVTASGSQFIGGRTHALSWGATCTSGQVIYRDGNGGIIWANTSGTNATSTVGGTAAPTGTKVSATTWMDVRLEYEFTTSNNAQVGLFIGDSITLGIEGTVEGGGIFPHETWPGAAGLRNGFAWVNLGVRGSASTDWTAGNDWKWTRVDLATTVPDFACISLGANELGITLATIKSRMVTIAANVRALGISRLYWGTIIPHNDTLGGSADLNRIAVNNWLRGLPCGAAGVFDFDKMLYLQSATNTVDTDYLAVYPHPQHAGYQRMAQAVAIGRQ